MKTFVLMGLVMSSSVVYAAERSLVDLQYLPNSGTTYGFSQVSLIDLTTKTSLGRSETTGYEIRQTIGHSITDRFSLEAELGYASAETETSNSGSSDDKTKSTGISDPTVTAKFRLLDEDVRWDLIGGALISLGDNEVKKNGDSNYLSGGHNLFVGTQFGAKKDNFQWSILGEVTHYMESTTDDKSASYKADDDAHNELRLEASLLTKLSEISYIRAAFGSKFTEGYEDDQSGEYAPSTIYTTSVEYRHLLSKDLMLRFGAANIDYFSTTSNVNWWTYVAGANYQF